MSQIKTKFIADLQVTNAKIANATIDLTTKVTGILPNTNTTATNLDTVSTIVARDSGGSFSLTNSSYSGYSDFNVIATPSTPGAGVNRLYSFTGIGGATQLAHIGPGGNQLVITQDSVINSINGSGGTITRGQAVIVQGSSAGVPNVVLAQANTIAGSLVFGLVQTASVANGGAVNVQFDGIVINVDTSAFSAGDTLYLSTVTPGALTNVAPSSPALLTKIGTVLTSSATVGTIILAIVNAVGTPIPVANIPFYFVPTASSDIAGYDQLSPVPSTGAEVLFTGTGVANVKTLIKAFATEPGSPSVVTLPSGTWVPQIYASVNSVAGGSTSTLTIDIFKRASGGTETLLFSVITPALTTLVTQYDLSIAESAFTLLSTDRLVFKASYTTTNAARIITFYTADNLHNSVITSTLNATIGVELQANKNTANGYAGLDGSTKLFLSQFPTVDIAHGGTGQITKAPAYDALSPMTTAGDIEYENATPSAVRLGIGSTGQVLTVAAGLPSWATPLVTKVEQLTLNGTDITNQYKDLSFAASGASASDNSILLAVIGGPIQQKTVSYTVSLTGGSGGVTRITFTGDLASGGSAALISGNILVINYDH